VALPVQLDGDRRRGIRRIDAVGRAAGLDLVLVHRLGKAGVLDEQPEQAGELGVGHALAPAAQQHRAARDDAGSAAMGMEHERSPQRRPGRKAEPSDLVERTEQDQLVAADAGQVEQDARRSDGRHSPADAWRSQVVGEALVDGDARAPAGPAVAAHRHLDAAGWAEALETPQVCRRAVRRQRLGPGR
jgi:hypothetical protein